MISKDILAHISEDGRSRGERGRILMTEYYAHSENSCNEKHSLPKHLQNTAKLAAEFPGQFGCAGCGEPERLRMILEGR